LPVYNKRVHKTINTPNATLAAAKGAELIFVPLTHVFHGKVVHPEKT